MAFLRSHGSLNVEMVPMEISHLSTDHSIQERGGDGFPPRPIPSIVLRSSTCHLPATQKSSSGHIYGAAVLQEKMVFTPNEYVHN